jgi:DNA helicase HerA-like ATPase
MPNKVGIVFNFNQLPDVSKFPFVISKRRNGILIKKGMFVHTNTNEGFLVGIIEKIVLLNEYFSDALTIKAYSKDNNPNILKGLFPSRDFEYAIAVVKCLGLIIFKEENNKKIQKIQRMSYPASPGAEVCLLEKEIIDRFLGFNIKSGLNLGKIKVSDYDVKVDLNRLLNKHISILAISGAGKSYLTSILIEELLMRDESYGTPATVLIDVHGEYLYLKDIPELNGRVKVFDSTYFQISVPKLQAYSFRKYQQQISNVQIRELTKYIKTLKKDNDRNGIYSLKDIIQCIENDTEGSKSTNQALIGWLSELEHLNLFGPSENPLLNNIIKNREITIFNLSKEINIRKKQIIVEYICKRLFYERRMNKIPPYLLIIEEAHQFCPEAAQSKAISKSIIETIAREGRKFMACLCLLSQRPKRLSTTALSQCNSKLILNIKNPYDLKHLMDSSEAITKEYTEMISSLGVGEMLMTGNVVNHPIFINIRERKFNLEIKELGLEDQCKRWQN